MFIARCFNGSCDWGETLDDRKALLENIKNHILEGCQGPVIMIKSSNNKVWQIDVIEANTRYIGALMAQIGSIKTEAYK